MLVRYSALVPRPSLLVARVLLFAVVLARTYAQTVHQYLPSSDPVTPAECVAVARLPRGDGGWTQGSWSRRSACDWLLSASFITTPHKVKTTAFREKERHGK